MLNTPYAAIDQVKKEIIAVGEISRDMVCESVEGFLNKDGEVIKKIRHHEDIVNEMEEELLHFIQKISQAQLNDVDIRTLDKTLELIETDDLEIAAEIYEDERIGKDEIEVDVV